MWFDTLGAGKGWSALWHGYILCGECLGIRRDQGPCAACGAPPYDLSPTTYRDERGREFVVSAALAGAEGRYEDWMYLELLQREWLRPVLDNEYPQHLASERRPSPRAIIVLQFWTYFESRIERLFKQRLQLSGIPEGEVAELLDKQWSIGRRLGPFYTKVFGSTYAQDLVSLGYSEIADHLRHVQERRNAFAHGTPQAIDDALVASVIEHLKTEHESWIAVFNMRASRASMR